MRLIASALSLFLAGSLAACTDSDIGSKQQRLRGHISQSDYSADVIGVRVVANGVTVTTANTDTDGNFDLLVPKGENYAFEVVTKSGTHTLLTGPLDEEAPLSFDVCDPGEDFDLGEIDPFDFEEVDGDDVPWSDTEDDCTIPPWICGEDGDPNDCIEEPAPCDDPNSDPDFCWVEPLPCETPNADPDFCYEEPPLPCAGPEGEPTDCIEPPPTPCDAPDGDPNDCIEPPPFPCDDPNVDPDSCEGEVPPGPPCDEENGDCGFEECENGFEDPACWPEVDVCVPGPNGEFYCDEDIGAAPEFPFPDFGCGEEIPVGEGELPGDEGGLPGGEGDLPPHPPEAPEPA